MSLRTPPLRSQHDVTPVTPGAGVVVDEAGTIDPSSVSSSGGPLAAPPDEAARIAQAYARRAADEDAQARYRLTQPDVWHTVQERQRATLDIFRFIGWHDLRLRRALEVGCGTGGNLLELLQFGFLPRHLRGIELLEDRFELACHRLPDAVRVIHGDAASERVDAIIGPATQDMVMVSTVFSSILDTHTRLQLADAMWRWVKPGGGVLWYDFTVNNPANPDVRGVPVAEVHELFPQAVLHVKPITLAPPIARRVCAKRPWLYHVFNAMPALRTHALIWAAKPAPVDAFSMP